jgi:hypothetical protein
MAVYGASIDVAALLPRGGAAGGDFGATDKPSGTQVLDFLTKLSARIDGRIRAAGYDPTTASANGILILKDVVISYVAGRVERIMAGVGMNSPDNKGKDWQAPYLELVDRLEKEPAAVALELGLTAIDGANTLLASFHTDSPDASDLTITPDRVFKIGGKL